MKNRLEDFKEKISKLEFKDKYKREELLIDDFIIDKAGDVEIYYAPHNEFINKKAKIFIVGITPGFQQMSTAISEAKKGVDKGLSIEEISQNCKRAGRFAGALRKNLIAMLDELELNKALNIESTKELFEDKDELLHSSALISYPVFVKGKNYTGHTPKILKNQLLMKYVNELFLDELKSLGNPLIIPLGRAVEDVIRSLVENGLIKEEDVLWGFTHPSGANVNRVIQFNENKENMNKLIKNRFFNLN